MLAAVPGSAALSSPSAPSQVMASATPGEIQLSWQAPALTQATVITYLITIDDLSTGAVSAPTASSDGAETHDTISGLSAGDSFDFVVQARTTDGEGQASQPSNTVVAIAAPGTSTGTQSPTPAPAHTPTAASRHRRPHRPRHVRTGRHAHRT